MSAALRLPLTLIAILCATYPSVSETMTTRLFGHDVVVSRHDEGERLAIDDREVLRNHYVSIDEVGLVDGTPVAIGTSSAGGNACEGAPFVISFPDGEEPRLDGPLDNCRGTAIEFDGDHLTFSSGALPGAPGERWTWTAASGFRTAGAITYQPDANRGWDQLRERRAGHPSDLFAYGEIADEIAGLAGDDLPLAERVLNGVGSGEFEGDWFIASGCTRHMCTIEEGLIAASLADRKLYLALKPDGRPILVRPPVAEWPERPRSALREWARTWP